MAGTLYVVPVMNTMGPVTDARHDDLLNTWADVDRCTGRIFQEDYRRRYPDSRGGPAIFSWFFISWSGFTSNPVQRDFGYFNVYDHYLQTFGDGMRRYGDGVYWMYNHPAASGVGNEWGLDWPHNTHYFNILNRYIIERGYFPSVVEVPTENNDASNWLENWFPFDVGNRNCRDLNLGATEVDGKSTSSVLDWSRAPDDWSEFHPSFDSHQAPGGMRRTVFRVLDVKTRIYELKESEIEKAFDRCAAGHNTFLSAYEHDFRDRAEVVSELLLAPVARLARKYPQVEWRYANALDGAKGVLGLRDDTPPTFEAELYGDYLRIRASEQLFSPTPYVAVKDLATEQYRHLAVDNVAHRLWQLDRDLLPDHCVLGIAGSDPAGNVGLARFTLRGNTLSPLERAGDPAWTAAGHQNSTSS